MENKAIVYIDGLNFYYGLVKGTRYKWLDFERFLKGILERAKKIFKGEIPPDLKVIKIKYFTTLVKGFSNDPQAPQRQMIFLKALEHTQNNFQIYYGSFSVNKKTRYLASPITDSSGNEIKKVEVIEPEEKGSDVNLAVHLVNDAWLNEFDWAIIVSNDSDLSEALQIVREQNRKKILLIPPISKKSTKNTLKKPASKLFSNCDAILKIRDSDLKNSQLPDVIPGTNIRKPDFW